MEKTSRRDPNYSLFFALVKDEVIGRRGRLKSHTEKTKQIFGDLSHVHIYTLEMSRG